MPVKHYWKYQIPDDAPLNAIDTWVRSSDYGALAARLAAIEAVMVKWNTSPAEKFSDMDAVYEIDNLFESWKTADSVPEVKL